MYRGASKHITTFGIPNYLRTLYINVEICFLREILLGKQVCALKIVCHIERGFRKEKLLYMYIDTINYGACFFVYEKTHFCQL